MCTDDNETCDKGDSEPCHPGFLGPPEREDPKYGEDNDGDFACVCIEALLSLVIQDRSVVCCARVSLTQAIKQAPMKEEPRYPAGKVICDQPCHCCHVADAKAKSVRLANRTQVEDHVHSQPGFPPASWWIRPRKDPAESLPPSRTSTPLVSFFFFFEEEPLTPARACDLSLASVSNLKRY